MDSLLQWGHGFSAVETAPDSGGEIAEGRSGHRGQAMVDA